MTLAIPTIVIPALTGLSKDIHPNEYIHLSPLQASWLGNIFGFVFLFNKNIKRENINVLLTFILSNSHPTRKCLFRWSADRQPSVRFDVRTIGS